MRVCSIRNCYTTQVRIVKGRSTMGLGGSSEPSPVDVSPPIACHGGTWGSMFRLQRMQNSTVNARDNQFILVQALDRDRVIALRPVGVSLCVGLIVSVVMRYVVSSLGTPPSFI